MSKPRIVTSSWFTALPPELCRIGISRGTPRGQAGFRMYRNLQPGPGTLKLPDRVFVARYFREVLQPLDAHQTVDELVELAAGKIPALLCFEHPPPNPKWCHRALVSIWLWEKLGLEVPEHGHESEGFGWSHPKLYPDIRRSSR
jgi:Protein of unknown function, DUF488